MTNTLKSKKELRRFALKTREEMLNNGATGLNSNRIIANILNSKEFNLAQNIGLYYPIKGEIDLRGLLEIKNKNFYLPRCIKDGLEFVKYNGIDSLNIGKYNILEPTGSAVNPSILDIIYIPALMANKNGYRLGYGKGYYDRFFAKNNIKASKVIVVANKLISDNFIQDTNDYKCDCVLSEDCLIFA